VTGSSKPVWLAVLCLAFLLLTGPVQAQIAPDKRVPAIDFPAKKDWLNTSGPLKMEDLKGKIVILDFWTLCCINCMHILPDLAKLEKKYPNELVVIGVHSAKFENEKDTKSIRKAVLRYEIAHPVINDADHDMWNAYNVQSWPSFAVIDAEGKFAGNTNGEGKLELLDTVVAKLIAEAKKKKVLNSEPIRFDLVRFRETGDTPLFFPGKIAADATGERLAIADSTHHRIVITDKIGKKLDVIGSGSPGYKNGKFAEVKFDDPQGMAFDGDLLYIADRKNHSLRLADLKAGTVKTIAGNGKQEMKWQDRLNFQGRDPLKTELNSPWDLLLYEKKLYIAMAGHHQIWVMDLGKNKIMPFAGYGDEVIIDDALPKAAFAQPSGLTTDGKNLYVADSEGSAIRKIPLDGVGGVTTLLGYPAPNRDDPRAGMCLFKFGDVDGTPDKAKLQHALAVVQYQNNLLIADTYNSKLKLFDPTKNEVKTLLGGPDPNDKDKGPLLNEPAGMALVGDTLYIADTNAHRVRVVNLKDNSVSTLAISGLEPPPPQKEWQPTTKEDPKKK
jgi:thiol-disulfide isomerase/thioredoxin